MALASPSLSYNTIFCEMRWLKCPLWFLPPPSFYIWFYYYTYIWFHLAVIYKYIIKALLLEQFWVNSKIEGKIQSYPMYSLPPQEHSLPMNNIVTHLLSLMNLHWHLVIIHSAQFTLGFALVNGCTECCTFCGFGQTYNDACPSLWNHAEYFQTLKILCALTSSHPQSLANTDLFLCVHSFCLLHSVIQLESYSMKHF